MSKLLANSILKVKQEIKNRYLAGDAIPSIAKHYGVSDRNIYYHLGTLTAEEQGLHAQNSNLKRLQRKEEHVKIKKTETVAKEPVPASDTNKDNTSLDDFE